GATTLTIQATVKAVAAGSVTLDVQGQSVAVPLPAGLTLPATLVGKTVTLNVSLDDQQGDDEQGDDHGGHRGHDGGGDDDYRCRRVARIARPLPRGRGRRQ